MAEITSGARLIGEGFGSEVYITDGGKILRVAKNESTQQKHDRERVVLSILTRHIKSVAIPEPSLIIQPSEAYPYGAIGYNQIPGKPLQPEDITPALRQPLANQIAQFISELHDIQIDEIKRHVELPAYLPTPAQLERMWERVAAYVGEHAPNLYATVEEAFAKRARAAASQTAPQALLHGDLWYENMIFDNDRIVGIIDFEAACLGDPIVDFMTQGYVDDDFRRLVVAAYQHHGAFEYNEELARCLMFLREMSGLDYGITTGDVDEDSLQKITAAAAKGLAQ